jgi:hypothetical protein
VGYSSSIACADGHFKPAMLPINYVCNGTFQGIEKAAEQHAQVACS